MAVIYWPEQGSEGQWQTDHRGTRGQKGREECVYKGAQESGDKHMRNVKYSRGSVCAALSYHITGYGSRVVNKFIPYKALRGVVKQLLIQSDNLTRGGEMELTVKVRKEI